MDKRLKLADAGDLISTSKKESLSPKVTKLLGVIKLHGNFDYKKELQKSILKKNLRSL